MDVLWALVLGNCWLGSRRLDVKQGKFFAASYVLCTQLAFGVVRHFQRVLRSNIPLSLSPFPLEHAILVFIPPPTLRPQRLPLPSLHREIKPLIQPLSTFVPLKATSFDPMKARSLEPSVEYPLNGVRAVALALIVCKVVYPNGSFAMMRLLAGCFGEEHLANEN